MNAETRAQGPGSPHKNGGAAGTDSSPSRIPRPADVPSHLQPVFGDDLDAYRRFHRLQQWLHRRRPYRDLVPWDPGSHRAVDYGESAIGYDDGGRPRIMSVRAWRRWVA